MKRLVLMLIGGVFAAECFCCQAEAECAQIIVQARVQARVEATPEGLTLADLLAAESCPQLLASAAHVSLGAAPRAGSVRVIAGSEIRRRLDELVDASFDLRLTRRMQIPDRVVVKRAGASKSCAEITSFLASAGRAREPARDREPWKGNLNCAAAHNIPEGATLELVKASSNPTMRRQEFWLHCAHADDCVPFLVWIREEKMPVTRISEAQTTAGSRFSAVAERASMSVNDGLVRAGQTATLAWDQAGIRIVLPVTCLEAGALGEFVRVRFKNAPRILRAEVVGKAMLRASL
jgi:hypothetical protein